MNAPAANRRRSAKLAAALWAAFEAAYLVTNSPLGEGADEHDPLDELEALDAYIATWETLKAYVGREDALRYYWAFQKTLPRRLQSDCDPDGG